MLDSISWEQYLTVLALVVLLYYLISSLLLFSNELVSLFKQTSRRNVNRLNPTLDQTSSDHGDLLGIAKIDVPHENKISSEDIVPRPQREIEEPVITPDAPSYSGLVVGSVADILEEIKSLASGLAGSTHEEVAAMFRQLLSRHLNLVGTAYQESLNLVIVGELADKCSINLEPGEIATWWPTPDSQIVNYP